MKIVHSYMFRSHLIGFILSSSIRIDFNNTARLVYLFSDPLYTLLDLQGLDNSNIKSDTVYRTRAMQSYSGDSTHFMEPEGSLPHSQVSATSSYHEPVRSRPYPISQLLKVSLNIILLFAPECPKQALSLRFPLTPRLSSTSYVLHAPPISPLKSLF